MCNYRIENQHLAQEMYRFVICLRREIVKGAKRRGFAWSSLHMDSSALTSIACVFRFRSAQEVCYEFQLKLKGKHSVKRQDDTQYQYLLDRRLRLEQYSSAQEFGEYTAD